MFLHGLLAVPSTRLDFESAPLFFSAPRRWHQISWWRIKWRYDMKLLCPYCGTENTFDDALYGKNIQCGACGNVFVGKLASLSTSVRKGVTDAKFNEEAASVVVGEILLLSVFAGLASSSWWCFGGAFIVLVIIIAVPQLAWIMSVFWSGLGYWLGKVVIEDIGAAVILSAIFGGGSYVLHRAAVQHAQDIGTS